TIHFEKPARAGEKTEFQVSYELTITARRFDVDADKVVPAGITAELAPFVAERAPHVVFTDDLRAFSRQVVGDETNPWKIARKLFDAVDRIPWAGAREYSTISNISDYALHAGHADCGQQTLLLVALLRLNGIPARWQSGMMFAPNGYWNLHDWGQLYIAPYGWMPMDAPFGRLDDADPADAGLYLARREASRSAFNDDCSRPFEPAPTPLRSATVGLQRGEAEWRGGNLYFDQWDYDFLATPQRPGAPGRGYEQHPQLAQVSTLHGDGRLPVVDGPRAGVRAKRHGCGGWPRRRRNPGHGGQQRHRPLALGHGECGRQLPRRPVAGRRLHPAGHPRRASGGHAHLRCRLPGRHHFGQPGQ